MTKDDEEYTTSTFCAEDRIKNAARTDCGTDVLTRRDEEVR